MELNLEKDSKLGGSMFSLAKNEDGSYTDAGLMDFWVWIFASTSVFASYFGKVAVRGDLQRAGFSIPGIFGPIMAVIFVYTVDVMDYNYFTASEAVPDGDIFGNLHYKISQSYFMKNVQNPLIIRI